MVARLKRLPDNMSIFFMGMYCHVWQIVGETIEDIKLDPSIWEEVLDELNEYNDELSDKEKILLDLDKQWDFLNFLIKRKSDSKYSEFLSSGGEFLPRTDQGYGDARYFDFGEVENILNLLRGMTFDNVADKIDLDEVNKNEVYPSIDDAEELTEILEIVKSDWYELMDFLRKTVYKKRGILTYIY